MLVDKSAEKGKNGKSTGAVVTDQFHYQLTKNFYSATFSAQQKLESNLK
jgi:hypothetical protein